MQKKQLPASGRDAAMAEAQSKRKKRVRFWLGIAVIGLGLLLFPALYVASMSGVVSEAAHLRAAGILCDQRDLIPMVPPGERNAADLYSQAFAASTITHADISLAYTLDAAGNCPIVSPVRCWSLEQRLAIRSILARNVRQFSLLEQAAKTPACVFASSTPKLRHMRDTVRWLGMRARLQAGDGDVDGALTSLRVALRMGEHAQADPKLFSQLMGNAFYYFAVKDLQEVFAAGDPSPAACRALFDQLGDVPLDRTWVRGLKHELAYHVEMLDQLRRGAVTPRALLNNGNPPASLSDLLATTYPTAGRPLLDLREVRYLRMMAQVIIAADKPWPQAKRVLEQLPRMSGPLKQILNYEGLKWQTAHEEAAARLGAMRIALALKAYRAEHGRYPATLADLEGAGWKLPRDPFTLRPYEYRRYGTGFLVYSLGPDGQDQHGAPAALGSPPWTGAYDVPFRCAR